MPTPTEIAVNFLRNNSEDRKTPTQRAMDRLMGDTAPSEPFSGAPPSSMLPTLSGGLPTLDAFNGLGLPRPEETIDTPSTSSFEERINQITEEVFGNTSVYSISDRDRGLGSESPEQDYLIDLAKQEREVPNLIRTDTVEMQTEAPTLFDSAGKRLAGYGKAAGLQAKGFFNAAKDATLGTGTTLAALGLASTEGFDDEVGWASKDLFEETKVLGEAFFKDQSLQGANQFAKAFNYNMLLGLGKALSIPLSIGRATLEKIPIVQEIFQGKPGEWLSSKKYWDATNAIWDDMISDQAEMADEFSRATGLPLEVAAGVSMIPYAAVNLVSPKKYLAPITAVVGASAVASVAIGTSIAAKRTVKGVKAAREAALMAKAAGHIDDAATGIREIADAGASAKRAQALSRAETRALSAQTLGAAAERRLHGENLLERVQATLDHAKQKAIKLRTAVDDRMLEGTIALIEADLPGHSRLSRQRLFSTLEAIYDSYDDIYRKYGRFVTDKRYRKDKRVRDFIDELELAKEEYLDDIELKSKPGGYLSRDREFHPTFIDEAELPPRGAGLEGLDDDLLRELDLAPEADVLFDKYRRLRNTQRNQLDRVGAQYRDTLFDNKELIDQVVRDLNPSKAKNPNKYRLDAEMGYDELKKAVADLVNDPHRSTSVIPSLLPKLSPKGLSPGEWLDNLQAYFLSRPGIMTLQARIRRKAAEQYFDKELLENGAFLLERTGNPAFRASDTYEDLVARLANNPQFEEFTEYLRDWQRANEISWKRTKEMSELLGLSEAEIADLNYVHHAWEGMHWGDPTKGRKIKTIAEGMQRGLTPRTLNVARMFEIGENRMARVAAHRKVLFDLLEANSLPAGSILVGGKASKSDLPIFLRTDASGAAKVPSNYTEIRAGLSDELLELFDKYVPTNGQSGKYAGNRYFIHSDIQKRLGNLLLEDNPGAFRTGLFKVASIAKRMNFLATLFHAYTLSESAVNLLGPVRGPLTALSLGLGVPGGNKIARKMGGDVWIKNLLGGRTMEEAHARAIAALVKAEAPAADVPRDVWRKFLDDMAEGLEKVTSGGKNRGAANPFRFLKGLQETVDTALWDDFHTPLKVIAFNTVYDSLLAKKRAGRKLILGGKRTLQTMSDDEIARSVGTFVNDEFGGQNWEALTSKTLHAMFGTKKKMMWWSTFFTSPDWNVSSFRASLAITQLIPGLKTTNPVRGYLGLKHWVNATIGTYLYANMLNYITTKADTGEGRFIFQNRPGRKFNHVYLGEDDEGQPIYGMVGKQYKELFEFLGVTPKNPTIPRTGVPPIDFFYAKTLPIVQKAMNPYGDIHGFRSDMMEMHKEAMKQGKKLGAEDYAWQYLKHIASGFIPFSISGASRINIKPDSIHDLARALGYQMLPLPKSGGTSNPTAVVYMSNMIRDGEFDLVIDFMDGMLREGMPMKQVIEALDDSLRKAKDYPTKGKLDKNVNTMNASELLEYWQEEGEFK